jgi:hypothetical protein
MVLGIGKRTHGLGKGKQILTQYPASEFRPPSRMVFQKLDQVAEFFNSKRHNAPTCHARPVSIQHLQRGIPKAASAHSLTLVLSPFEGARESEGPESVHSPEIRPGYPSSLYILTRECYDAPQTGVACRLSAAQRNGATEH